MKIQKVYSEVNTDEKLFSVLLSEEEYQRLYANLPLQKEIGYRIGKAGSDLVERGLKALIKDPKLAEAIKRAENIRVIRQARAAELPVTPRPKAEKPETMKKVEAFFDRFSK